MGAVRLSRLPLGWQQECPDGPVFGSQYVVRTARCRGIHDFETDTLSRKPRHDVDTWKSLCVTGSKQRNFDLDCVQKRE